MNTGSSYLAPVSAVKNDQMRRNNRANSYWMKLLFLSAALAVLVSGCGESVRGRSENGDNKLRIVVTTTFIGDVVENIAGEAVDLTVLLEPGQNPHSYQPAPMDMVAVTDADLILANGFGLEEFLDDLLAGSDSAGVLIAVSEGIEPLVMDKGQEDHDHDDPVSGEMGLDPHVWFDPNSLIVWVDNITGALEKYDPDQRELYQDNADAYKAELKDLDRWIREQISSLPEENRKLVTGHLSLGYFVRQYGLVEIGAVIPALTTEAETSGMGWPSWLSCAPT